MPWGKDEEWIPPERYSGERPDLEAEMRRIVALTREAQTRRETIERQLRARLAGFRPIDEIFEQAERREVNGNGNRNQVYPSEWFRLADEARSHADPNGHKARLRSEYRDD